MDPASKTLPEEVLLRSRIEITRVLDALCAAQDPIVTYLDSGETLLVTHLLEVEPKAGHLVVDFGDSKAGNVGLFALQRVKFVCAHSTCRIEFVAANPREIARAGRLALKLDFPEMLLRLQRRERPRIRVHADADVRCSLEVAPGRKVEGQVADIGASGFGALLLDPGVPLKRGDLVRNVRIDLSWRKRVVVDVEISYCTAVMVNDKAMRRFGCRFLGADDAIESLMHAFIVDLSGGT